MLDILYSLIPQTLFFAAPLIFTALGGVYSERSGVINIGLEGLMVIGAFAAVTFNLLYANALGTMTPWISLLVAMVASAVFSLLLAIPAITFRADQTVTGVAINMLALGFGVFMIKQIFNKGQTEFISEPIYTKDVPGLVDIPVIGEMFFNNMYITSYIAIAFSFVAWYVLFKTPFGLRIRAVGEHPMAADTNGIKVYTTRYIAVIISGALAGIGGGVFAMTISLNFSVSTIAGQGFMAIAAVIFGKWNPLGAMGAALFFGFAQSLSVVGSSIPLLENVPQVYLLIAPYVLTILALAGFIGRSVAPKASGVPYVKGSR
ncbi:nucleoside ABC transporter membrane protein [Terribacillus aidingensis]|uniref:Nucleoside ABC transporter membrane protein n=1 Tax=Terribacillus aidingensis TaxID=586416 RepID=A0A285NJY6_9BACI|nr:ABC transporter permease [Terribacillus aidingensis]SNZ09779.1 nucleoside ABC transporter membrane protein [Terribacillus aidingensis]